MVGLLFENSQRKVGKKRRREKPDRCTCPAGTELPHSSGVLLFSFYHPSTIPAPNLRGLGRGKPEGVAGSTHIKRCVALPRHILEFFLKKKSQNLFCTQATNRISPFPQRERGACSPPTRRDSNHSRTTVLTLLRQSTHLCPPGLLTGGCY